MPRVEVLLPAVLTEGEGSKRITEEASNLRELFELLVKKHGISRARLLDGEGKIRRLLNVYVNGKNVRLGAELDTPLQEGDEVSIIPAVAGG